MIAKHILNPKRIRRIPRHFSWLDHRLVREGHISRCSHAALALYLFLVTVSDAEGLSYYSDRTAGHLLNMNSTELSHARRELCKAGLAAYAKPLYQVLSLAEPVCSEEGGGSPPGTRNRDAVSIGDILRQMTGGDA